MSKIENIPFSATHPWKKFPIICKILCAEGGMGICSQESRTSKDHSVEAKQLFFSTRALSSCGYSECVCEGGGNFTLKNSQVPEEDGTVRLIP